MIPRKLALTPPGPVRWIARTLEEAGFETWVVGGAIRDTLLGLPAGDWDLTTRARPGDMRRIFRRTVPVGIEHGTVGILARDGTMYEVTTFRRDVETSGRHAVVEFADGIDEDLARRDFTMNAVAWHPLRSEFRDPWGGVGDLDDRILRTVGSPDERFREDYLRILRALRFAGRFGLMIEPGTWRALCEARTGMRRLSAERVREELMKVLEGSPRPSAALGLYAASGALAVLLPELDRLIGSSDPPRQVDDLWSHVLLVVDGIGSHRPRTRLAGLLHSVGLPSGPVAGPPSGSGGGDDGGSGPVEAGVSPRAGAMPEGGPTGDPGALRAAAIMERLRFSRADISSVCASVAASTAPPPAGAGAAVLRRWLSRVGPEALPDLFRLWIADARVRESRAPDGGRPSAEVLERWRSLRRVLAARPPLAVRDLAVGGRDLIGMGLRPGPRFGEILEQLLDRVLDDPELNEPGTLLGLARELLEATGPGVEEPGERGGRT